MFKQIFILFICTQLYIADIKTTTEFSIPNNSSAKIIGLGLIDLAILAVLPNIIKNTDSNSKKLAALVGIVGLMAISFTMEK